VFKKKLVLLPIYEGKHWSLIVLMNLGSLTNPLALHLDPCELHKAATYEAKLQQWLNNEHRRIFDLDYMFSSLKLIPGKGETVTILS
jgi:hypothetical protein